MPFHRATEFARPESPYTDLQIVLSESPGCTLWNRSPEGVEGKIVSSGGRDPLIRCEAGIGGGVGDWPPRVATSRCVAVEK
jgi:hypothetical protein